MSMGGITVTALADGVGPFFQPRAEAFPQATAAHWSAADARDPGAVRDGEWLLRFRCFAVRLDSGRLILVDAGIGSAASPARAWAPVPGRLPDELSAAGIAPSDVDTVVLTHMHTDHIGWAVDGGRPYFPNARYVMQRAEVETIDRLNPAVAEWLLAPLRSADQLTTVDGDEVLATGVRVIATPGHTPGHQSVLVTSGEQNLLVTGDLLVHAVQLVDPNLAYAHEMDPDLARRSRVGLLTELATGTTTLATPHLGEPFTAWRP